MKRILVGLTALGIIALAGCSATPSVTITADPQPVVTVTAKPEGVAAMPQSCADAFEDAEAIFDVAATVATYASDAILLIPEAAEAGMNYDGATMERIADDLDGISSGIAEQTALVNASAYAANRDSCLSGE
jgi:ABC-type Fe3+-hydroxamate transport system substrate-binding protein